MKNQKLSLNQIKRNDAQLKKCRTTQQLAILLKSSPRELTLHSFEPRYYHFKIPKKQKGEFRYIEAPSQELKRIQRKLNNYLQPVYYLHQTAALWLYYESHRAKKQQEYIHKCFTTLGQ